MQEEEKEEEAEVLQVQQEGEGEEETEVLQGQEKKEEEETGVLRRQEKEEEGEVAKTEAQGEGEEVPRGERGRRRRRTGSGRGAWRSGRRRTWSVTPRSECRSAAPSRAGTPARRSHGFPCPTPSTPAEAPLSPALSHPSTSIPFIHHFIHIDH